jgi:hypothetical protein
MQAVQRKRKLTLFSNEPTRKVPIILTRYIKENNRKENTRNNKEKANYLPRSLSTTFAILVAKCMKM